MSHQIEFDNIIQLNSLGHINAGCISGYDIPEDINKSQLFMSLIAHTTTSPINNIKEHNINFKMGYYYNIYEFIIIEMNKVYNNKKSNTKIIIEFDNIIKNILLSKLSVLLKGQVLLNKLLHRINTFNLTDTMILIYLIESARVGTFMNFIFWLNKSTFKSINKLSIKDQEDIFILSIGNSDDRLFKFILNKIISNDKLIFQKNALIINKLIDSLARSQVPAKYILKRIKMLSGYISLIPYFAYMISAFNSDKVILELHTHYYVIPHNFNSISSLISTFIKHKYNNETGIFDVVITNNFELLIEKLITIEEKIMVHIILGILHNIYQKKYINHSIINNIVIENYIKIIEMITWDNISYSNKILSSIINSLTSHNLINKYILENNILAKKYYLMLYTRFLPIDLELTESIFIDSHTIHLIHINLLLHKLRVYVKTKCKKNKIQNKIKMFDLLREIKSFSPNKNVSILKQGSIQYQNQKQKFTNLPPRHLLPGEINIYQQFLLKEKADGILINNLPVGIYPHINILSNYQVKAEYIEELDIYLIFDIDIPNTTIEERYDILRRNHPLTCNTSMQTINSLDDFIKIFLIERNIIKQFIKDNRTEPIKWFPKFTCKYINSNNLGNLNNLNTELIQKIILEQDKEINKIIFNSEPFKCDGLILTPLDGSREIKIKPRSLVTIDLLFNNKKWLDRNNNDWSHIIIKSNKPIKEGRIYRCYPNDTFTKFNIGEYRYDKKKPNPYIIVDNIIVILEYNWLNDLNQSKSYYYDSPKKITSQSIIDTIKTQSDNFISEIKNLVPELNKSWLDLGCGRGKLIPIIKNYNPKKYLGIDADINQLIKALHYNDINQEIYTFNPCNLDKNWNDTPIKWNNQNNIIKYDYIIANFSLMHFCTDDFWTQLNKIIHSETIFLFNLVSIPDNTLVQNSEWSESNSYLKIRDNQTIYKFEWIHDDEKIEPYISDEKITEYCRKYNWKVVNNYSLNSKHQLINFYKWWIIKPNI